ncbi:GNAT family N-acetyltransferase [Verrucomicrobiota bacterium]
MKVREATPEDHERLKELKLLSKQEEVEHSDTLRPLEETKHLYLKYLSKDLAHKERTILVAVEDSEIVGIVLAKIMHALPISKHPRKGYISNLYVVEGSRRKGIGTELARRALDWLTDQEVHLVSLEIHEGNAAAQKLYRDLGFRNYTIKMTAQT